MPKYLYRFLDDGTEVTVVQPMSEDPFAMLDGRPVRRLMTPPNVFWKGTSPALEDFWASGNPDDIPQKGT